MLQFLERWSTAIGAPAICPNISGWRRSVCGDLVTAFDFENPVYGLPDLPFVTTLTGDAGEYRPVPAGSEMPSQESGTRPARPVPCQPNANLAGFTATGGVVTADLALSNAGAHVSKASHFSVYDNTLAAAPPMKAFPAGFPGQYTVAPSRRIGATTAATAPVGDDGGYDITVVGPNRFLRRFTGNIAAAGAGAHVTADYYAEGGGPGPALLLTLANGGNAELAFTVTPDHYPAGPARIHRVPPGQRAVHELDPVAAASGWYDVTVTIDGDDSWSQRFTGHLETGQPSVTG